ncbi:MAG: hypothetical protein HY815_25930, partial [Candidatus Riflebacteria bacterium]|nr:hypothetical protein [Candidatus Riflebacteria bacterium]
APELAASLATQVGGTCKITADEGTNSLVMVGSEGDLSRANQLICTLDLPPPRFEVEVAIRVGPKGSLQSLWTARTVAEPETVCSLEESSGQVASPAPAGVQLGKLKAKLKLVAASNAAPLVKSKLGVQLTVDGQPLVVKMTGEATCPVDQQVDLAERPADAGRTVCLSVTCRRAPPPGQSR